jgi:hypothetical protein
MLFITSNLEKHNLIQQTALLPNYAKTTGMHFTRIMGLRKKIDG